MLNLNTTQPRRITHDTAIKIAKAFETLLSPGCIRIALAGSVRRRTNFSKDIEFVVIAKPAFNLYGEVMKTTQLDNVVELLQETKQLGSPVRNGSKWKTLPILDPGAGINLELFITTPKTWATTLLIRTGPVEFAKRYVTPKQKSGLLPDNMRQEGGRLWRVVADGGESKPREDARQLDGPGQAWWAPIDTPEERDVFAAIGLPYIEPQDRH